MEFTIQRTAQCIFFKTTLHRAHFNEHLIMNWLINLQIPRTLCNQMFQQHAHKSRRWSPIKENELNRHCHNFIPV